jgi:GT2 family glycosyltransferase
MTPRLSLVVSVLESYEVVRRQLLHLGRVLPPGCELVLVDDGSEPSLEVVFAAVAKPYAATLHLTHDRRPWTQPKGRNAGARLARADRLLFFDVDHILTREVLDECLRYQGDKLHWVRRPAVLDADGRVVTDLAVLREYGLTDEAPSVHGNSFLIRKSLFDRLGGYDESFCGRYGGDDVDFNARYAELCRRGLARPEEVRGEGYVYPDPAADVRRLFHSLRGPEARA